jgi:hypothetical protein
MGACGQGVASSNVFFMIMLIQQLISCGIRMIMVCDAVPPGQTRTERARARRESPERPS